MEVTQKESFGRSETFDGYNYIYSSEILTGVFELGDKPTPQFHATK